MEEHSDKGRDVGKGSRYKGEISTSIQRCRYESKFQGWNFF